ncbi:MAG TPA: hypothetical protein VFS08_05310, partial [Gemmatimonadaceae bacterium]|nr:hypothetical protein [Gemmatimonadaceae bacterium]
AVATPGGRRAARDEAAPAVGPAGDGSSTAAGAPASPAATATRPDLRPDAAARQAAGQLAAPMPRRGARDEHDAATDGERGARGGDATTALGHELAGGAPDGARHHAGGPTAVRAGAPVAAGDALARLDQIDLLREGAAARPLSHLTLALDGAGGATDRVRVALRGNDVGATLELSDAVTAHRVGAHLGELQQALEQRGLRAEALQVRQHADVAPDAIAMGRVAGLALEREAARGGSHSSTGQQPAPQRERDGRPSPDASHRDSSSPHQRSRREPKDGR